MRIHYTPEQLKRAQRNGGRARNKPPVLRCPECGSVSHQLRKVLAIFSCNNCKFSFTETEAPQKMRHETRAPKSAVPARKGDAPEAYRYEWKPLNRKPFAHAELALLTRR